MILTSVGRRMNKREISHTASRNGKVTQISLEDFFVSISSKFSNHANSLT